MHRLIRSSIFFMALCIQCATVQAQPVAEHIEGTIASGATYIFDIPKDWNGTVLLFSHGYAAGPANAARNYPRNEKDWLLQHGYALIGSSFSKPGWAIAEAVPDQLATLDEFVKRMGKPKRVLAWGSSMGGLVTVAMMEQFPDRIDGGLALCASISGTVGMMNATLDGAFVFKSLVAPDSDLVLRINMSGDAAKAELAKWKAKVDAAQLTPEGRVRIALAATLAQVPTWVERDSKQPAANDYAAQQRQLYLGLIGGSLTPRDDQEMRAGGNFSWNTGVDYREMLKRSGREEFIRSLYRDAGVSLDIDLATLANAPRISAKPEAIAYMKKNYAPTGEIKKPMLLVQAVADPATLTELTGDYASVVKAAGKAELVRDVYVNRTGHCNFNLAETIASIKTLETRVDIGVWGDAAAVKTLNTLADSYALDGGKFVEYKPAALLRSCTGREKKCLGEP